MIPTAHFALGFDSNLLNLFLLEEIKSYLTQDGEVFC